MITAGKQRSVIWHEDEAFWLAMAPLFFGTAQWDAAAEEAEQAGALLGIWGASPATLMLGDFNAVPGSAAIDLLRAAGLRDASALLPPAGRGTTTRLDGRQIDWIFATRDLAFEATTMPYSRASDHLPVVTTVHLTTRFGRGASAPPIGAPGIRRPPG